GVIPQYGGDGRPDDLRDLRAWLSSHGVAEPFDVIAEGETPAGDGERARSIVRPWRDAGATWWMETRWSRPAPPTMSGRSGSTRTTASAGRSRCTGTGSAARRGRPAGARRRSPGRSSCTGAEHAGAG